jgi:ABC-type transport system involved in cytochrome c biogenesis permease subunit
MMRILIAIILLYAAGIFLRHLLYAGIFLHAGYILSRTLSAGRLPVVGLSDTLLFFSFSIAIFSLAFVFFITHKKQFQAATSGTTIACILPVLLLPSQSGPLPPVLKTFWFEIHVVLSFFSYALFVIGGITGVLFLWHRVPDIERLQYRSIFIGYTLFSVSMIAGGIWAFYAWGSYWLWTPKEIWTSVLWLYYSLYLHLRFHKNFAGPRASLAGTFGTLAMLFTYLGVGILMKSSHSF